MIFGEGRINYRFLENYSNLFPIKACRETNQVFLHFFKKSYYVYLQVLTFQFVVNDFFTESESESDDEISTEETSVFYSVYENRAKQKIQVASSKKKGQSYISFSLHIGQGLLSMNPPARDVATKVIPGQHGELLLVIEYAHLFVVNGYKGDNDLGYVCVQAKNVQMYHCGEYHVLI